MKQAVYAELVGAVKDADAHLLRLPLQRRCCVAVKAQLFRRKQAVQCTFACLRFNSDAPTMSSEMNIAEGS